MSALMPAPIAKRLSHAPRSTHSYGGISNPHATFSKPSSPESIVASIISQTSRLPTPSLALSWATLHGAFAQSYRKVDGNAAPAWPTLRLHNGYNPTVRQLCVQSLRLSSYLLSWKSTCTAHYRQGDSLSSSLLSPNCISRRAFARAPPMLGRLLHWSPTASPTTLERTSWLVLEKTMQAHLPLS